MKLSRKTTPAVLIVSFLLSAGCVQRPVRPAVAAPLAAEEWVKKVLIKMTLEEKIGQMICCRYSGSYINRDSDFLRDLKGLVVDQKIGGLILFGGNVYETAHLTNVLQEMAEIPLLISSDLERGLGNQIEGATLFPPLMSLGAVGSEDLAYAMGRITALEALAVGIHVTYAPVMDVNINPENPIINTRSFGEDPEAVSRLGVAFIKGCQENGLIATAKHFPGHGDTSSDSHSVLPEVSGDRNRLEKVELYPFQRAIAAGVQAIMTAHLHLPALDPTVDLPATLSHSIITELLREKLEFEGIIVTDAMDMGGVTTLYSPEEAALRAVKAGVDMILLPPKPKEVIDSLVENVRSGEISEERIDQSVKRILEAKERLGLHRNKLVDLDALDEKIASKEHLQVAAQAFENSITLVKYVPKLLPLSGKKKIAVLSLSSDPGGYFAGRSFVQEIKNRCPLAAEFYADAFTGAEFLQEAVKKAAEADAVVIALFSRLGARKGSVDIDLRHIQIVKDLIQWPVPVVAVSFGSPYFIKHFPEVDAYLCAYRYAEEAQRAAVRALFGEIEIKGRLPVSIPGLYPMGFGIVLPEKSGDNEYPLPDKNN